MITYEEIINYSSNYKIENGIVIDIRTNQKIFDEDITLRVKSSILLINEAKADYDYMIQLFGKTSKTKEYFIKNAMIKFGTNNEINKHGYNKLINAILSSNGHYEENMSGQDIFTGKFSILVGQKKDYGLAYLKLKFRQRGLDIDELRVSQDLSELKSNGVSRVIIDFKVKKYQKNNGQTNQSKLIQHPKAKELNELERQKEKAKQNGDIKAYNYYQSLIEKIVKENIFNVSSEQWSKLSDEEKISFFGIKINEAKVLKDIESYNYWKANLKILQDKIKNKSDAQINLDETTLNEKKLNYEMDLSVLMTELKSQLNQIKTKYNAMLSDGIIDDEELAILISMVEKVISDGYSLKNIATSQSDIKTISGIINMLEEEQRKITHIKRIKLIQHPKAKELNELEKQKKTAKQNGNIEAYNYYQSLAEKIVKENIFNVSSEQWSKLSDEEKISFYGIKINEAKVLRNIESYNYWKAKLKILQDKIKNNSDAQIKNNQSPKSSSKIEQENAQSKKEELSRDYKYFYEKMIEIVRQYDPNNSMPEEQKKQFLGRIFYYETYMIDRVKSNEEIRELMTLAVNELNDNDMQKSLFNSILTELQEKYVELNSSVQQEQINLDKSKLNENKSNYEMDLSFLMNELKNQLNQIKTKYNVMLSDGIIDDEEIAILISMVGKVISDGYSLKNIATSQSDIKTISVIINMLEEEQRKITHMKRSVEEIDKIL